MAWQRGRWSPIEGLVHYQAGLVQKKLMRRALRSVCVGLALSRGPF